MKIVLISFLYEPELGGGAAVVVKQLAHALVQRSHSVVVITSWQGRGIKIDYVDGIKIIHIPPLNLYWVGEKDKQSVLKKVVWQLVDIWNPLVYRFVRQILINEQADIVHSHKLRGLSPSIWSAAASAGAKKIIHTCHDFELLSPEGLFMGWVGRLAKEQDMMMRPYQVFRRYFSRLVDDATAPSRFVLEYHKKLGFFSRARTGIVPNSHGYYETELQNDTLEISRFPRENLARRFLFLGRLDKAKGIDLLCQAFLQISDKNHEFQLIIAGWGPLEASLRDKYRLHTNIEFTGAVFGGQKEELFRECDVLVVPSIAPESFGLVICEAYFHGIPVIATQVGGFSEIIRDGETGLLVKSGSVDELYSALARVSNEHNLLRKMSINCFEEARKYTPEKLINNYIAVYEDRR